MASVISSFIVGGKSSMDKKAGEAERFFGTCGQRVGLPGMECQEKQSFCYPLWAGCGGVSLVKSHREFFGGYQV